MHDPPAEAVQNPEVQTALDAEVAAGRILHYGVSSGDEVVLRASLDMPNCSVLQLPLSPLNSAMIQVAADAGRRGIAVVANHVFSAGRLLSLPGDGGARVAACAAAAGVSLPALLLGFAASRPGVTTALTGTRDPEHLRSSAAELDQALTLDTLEGLMRAVTGTSQG